MFFGPDNQGTGSGCVAMTLDGMSAQAIIDSGTPSGCIAIWSSTVGSIPAGWYLCDGQNGTPNLRDRFVVGAGGNYSAGEVGGSMTVTTAATVTIAGHALTASELAKHQHGTITDYWPSGTNANFGPIGSTPLALGGTDTKRYTGSAGSGDAHGHTASFAGTGNQDMRPPFYALCYVMKA